MRAGLLHEKLHAEELQCRVGGWAICPPWKQKQAPT